MQAKVLQVIPVGDVPITLLRELEGPLQTELGISSLVAKSPLAAPTYAFNKDRNQYHSNAIMRRLSPLLEGPGRLGLGVCEVDLFVPDSPFVFGEADREAKVAVLSLTRLRQGADPDLLRRRFQVEGIHQAGHLLGLSYCEDARCAMFLASSVLECDRKGTALCNLCRNELVKLSR